MWNMQSIVKRYSKHIYLNKFSLENGKQIIITNILGSVTMYHMQKKNVSIQFLMKRFEQLLTQLHLQSNINIRIFIHLFNFIPHKVGIAYQLVRIINRNQECLTIISLDMILFVLKGNVLLQEFIIAMLCRRQQHSICGCVVTPADFRRHL